MLLADQAPGGWYMKNVVVIFRNDHQCRQFPMKSLVGALPTSGDVVGDRAHRFACSPIVIPTCPCQGPVLVALVFPGCGCAVGLGSFPDLTSHRQLRPKTSPARSHRRHCYHKATRAYCGTHRGFLRVRAHIALSTPPAAPCSPAAEASAGQGSHPAHLWLPPRQTLTARAV